MNALKAHEIIRKAIESGRLSAADLFKVQQEAAKHSRDGFKGLVRAEIQLAMRLQGVAKAA